MQKRDSTTFEAADNEQVTFSLANTVHVSGASVSVDGATGGALPVTVTGGQHLITVAVGFTGTSGGSAEIQIVGSLGGNEMDQIAQIPGVPFRNRTYQT